MNKRQCKKAAKKASERGCPGMKLKDLLDLWRRVRGIRGKRDKS
jgi:hypothetical protein